MADIFRHMHRVTYSECTAGNHIYHARYLDILEAARGEFVRSLGVTLLQLQERDMIFPVIECRVQYKFPARYDDLLAVELWPAFAKGARINFAHRVFNQNNQLIIQAETFHVCTGLNEKPKRMPDDVLKLFEKLVRPPPPVL